MEILVPYDQRRQMEAELLESFQGTALVEITEFGYYAKAGKELILFEEKA